MVSLDVNMHRDPIVDPYREVVRVGYVIVGRRRSCGAVKRRKDTEVTTRGTRRHLNVPPWPGGFSKQSY